MYFQFSFQFINMKVLRNLGELNLHHLKLRNRLVSLLIIISANIYHWIINQCKIHRQASDAQHEKARTTWTETHVYYGSSSITSQWVSRHRSVGVIIVELEYQKIKMKIIFLYLMLLSHHYPNFITIVKYRNYFH